MNRAVRIITFLFILLILAVGAAGYFFWQYRKASQAVTGDSGSIATSEEVAQTVALVSRHAVLPQGETPTVATITDTQNLEGQDFFKNARNGYKVLVYSLARLAVLYDPELDRIVNMATINAEGPGVNEEIQQDASTSQDVILDEDSSTDAEEIDETALPE